MRIVDDRWVWACVTPPYRVRAKTNVQNIYWINYSWRISEVEVGGGVQANPPPTHLDFVHHHQLKIKVSCNEAVITLN